MAVMAATRCSAGAVSPEKNKAASAASATRNNEITIIPGPEGPREAWARLFPRVLQPLPSTCPVGMSGFFWLPDADDRRCDATMCGPPRRLRQSNVEGMVGREDAHHRPRSSWGVRRAKCRSGFPTRLPDSVDLRAFSTGCAAFRLSDSVLDGESSACSDSVVANLIIASTTWRLLPAWARPLAHQIGPVTRHASAR